ncbi:Ti-type conjugative transfer relaxase TraA [Aliirhizobium smilacinae]|uniref:Ti-type conjugative transfer relaxase TraA n=1 Tax=Aliirhizobium smilacinae TaxID=1395944 RepID=A0A5C4XU43_9HYPH|nr:Ti-type conjugative transfer relaxase TraA [Rhizobium smilacinae]TNM66140.1 Ti-type conjugative transfer relaxase TraA [Rhizobium smilacinae]
MAIYHCSMKPIARAAGRSAVAAVAYRTASRLLNERDGLVHDFTGKRGVEHCEIVLPEGVEAAWARDRATLWNAAERAEKRSDARVAREFELALPHELTRDQQIVLTRAFAQDMADRHGAAVDFAIHRPIGDTDIRNVHAHVLMTTRQVVEHGLGDKTLIERENKWLLNHNQPTAQMQLRDIRRAWESHANRALMRAGLDIRVDHRGHLERGLEIEPTEHMGVHASQMDRRGLGVSRARNEQKAAARNASLIREKPEQVLALITAEKSVFDRHDVARTLHRYIDDVQAFQNAFAAVMASPALVELQPEGNGQLARYSTKEMVTIEHAMASSASTMAGRRSHGVDVAIIAAAMNKQDDAIKASVAGSLGGPANHDEMPGALRARLIDHVGLSAEQRVAVKHVTGPAQIAAVVGFAGAGKSTMLAAARDAWERQGYRVHGAALAGKAAEGLEESSDIASRTLASWDYGWQRGRGELGPNDIFVIDEAGMVGSRQLAMFVNEIQARGAKLVLVGDHEQLQAIGAGSPFRAIVEQVGAVELSEIRRQQQAWQRETSIALATHRTAEALAAYAGHGDVRFLPDREATTKDLVTDYLADVENRPSGSRIALAHRRVDVRAINTEIRAGLQEQGKLARGEDVTGELGRERVYQTIEGERSFAPGDRIVMLENNRDLGLKNGMLGNVMAVEQDAIQIRLDGGGLDTREVTIPVNSYQAFDHGYATTIHKSQGSTVDRAFVMASKTLDRHLTYVALTRHREQVGLYVRQDEMKDLKSLASNLGRSGAKQTTLDYTDVFASRRGIAADLGISSDIAIGLKSGQRRERSSTQKNAIEEPLRNQAGLPQTEGDGPSGSLPPDTVAEKVEPLIPAKTSWSRTVEDIAREKAMPHLVQSMESVRSVGRLVYDDPEGSTKRLTTAVLGEHRSGLELAKVVASHPEEFGKLRGKHGLLGENALRKAARHRAKALGTHVAFSAETWNRRYGAEKQSETWKRERLDIIEVPGLSSRSEQILTQLSAMPVEEKSAFLEKINSTPEGRVAMEEARRIAEALTQRFGSSDPRDLITSKERLTSPAAANVGRIAHVAGICHRAWNDELAQKCELQQLVGRRLGLGLSR